MNSFVKFIISLSLSGSIIMIILMGLSFFLKNKFSKSWQYYIWIIVILRFLLPFSVNVNIVNNLFDALNDNRVEKIQNYELDYKNLDITYNYDYEVINNGTASRNLSFSYYLAKVVENLTLIWFIGFMIMLLNKLVSYKNYIRFIKASCRIVDDNNIKEVFESVCKKLGIKNIPILYANKVISTPTSLGIIKPFVVIPSKLLNLSTSKLEYIFLHELIHIKYYDVVYKWIAQFTLCVHFFNPFVYLMEKKIDKLCELACDEKVVSLIDNNKKKCYGEVIVESLEAEEGYNSEVISISLCDNTKFIKERLVEIMSFKRKSKINILISTIVAISLSMVATVAGVYTDTNLYANEISVESESDIIPTDEVDKFVLEQIKMEANWHNAMYFFEHMSPRGVKEIYDILIQYSNSDEDTKIAYRCIDDTDKKYTYKPLYKSKVDLYAIDRMQKTGNWKYVESLFPYMTQKGADKVVSIYVQKTGNTEKVKAASKYMSNESKKTYESQSSQDYDKMAEQLIGEGKSIFDIMRLMPYMSDEKTIQILKDYIDKTNEFSIMYNTRQFMSIKAIDEVTKYYVDKTGDFGVVTAMLQFLSKDMSNYIANKYFESSYDKDWAYLFTPYLNN